MNTVKDVKKVDNYLCATIGKIDNEPVFLNVLYVSHGKIYRLQRYFDFHFPIKLHDKTTRILEELKQEYS